MFSSLFRRIGQAIGKRSRGSRPASSRTDRWRRRPQLEALEDRLLMAVFTVTNTSSSGAGSLRQAILNANSNPGSDAIHFNIGGGGAQRIFYPNHPVITGPVVIDATTQPGYVDRPLITLGPPVLGWPPAGYGGLVIQANGSTVRGLEIHNLDGNGIELRGGGNVIEGCWIRDNDAAGIMVTSAGNRIGGTTVAARNVIGANGWEGIYLTGPGARDNIVRGNHLGVSPSGTIAWPNGHAGVGLFDGASANTIGGTMAAARNVISGNSLEGVFLGNGGTSGNAVLGNYIGTNATGTAALPNGWAGVRVANHASNNTIGGTTPGARNVISGNGQWGVFISDSSTRFNTVQGNYVGTNAAGTAALRNGIDGIAAYFAPNNLIGGTTPAARNLVSGNARVGIWVYGDTATGNIVQGNYVGTNVTGTAPLGNLSDGITVQGGAADNFVGGNLASANAGWGVMVRDGATRTTIQGNYVGTNAAGTAALGNGIDGIAAYFASNNLIGGSTPGARNLVSGNAREGIWVYGNVSTGNTIQGNYVGTSASGTAPLGNLGDGIAVQDGAADNLIGGTAFGAGNLVSGNARAGVALFGGTGTAANRVQGNLIGLDATGTAPLGNAREGVFIGQGASDNLIGGTAPGAGNFIGFNGLDGVGVFDAGTTVNRIEGNYIYGNALNGVAGYGVSGNTIGGAAPGAGNWIAYNAYDGVYLDGGTGNTISGNSIFANGYLGIDLVNGANADLAAPYLYYAASGPGYTYAAGVFVGAPNQVFIVEVFASSFCNPFGFGDGEYFLGTVLVVTDGDGVAYFDAFFAEVPAGFFLTATITDAATGDTSSFSYCAEVLAG